MQLIPEMLESILIPLQSYCSLVMWSELQCQESICGRHVLDSFMST